MITLGFRRWRVWLVALLGSVGAVAGVLAQPPDVVVAQDGTGDYRTVQAAIDAAPASLAATRPWVIRIKPGYYYEVVYIMREKRGLLLRGDDPLRTTLSYNLVATQPGVDGRPIGTFRTASTQVDADDFSAENLTFDNSCGPNGQALAIRIDGDRAVFRNCRFLGWQDTVLANRGRHYFEDCFIAGHVDFIFGGATAYFERCTLHAWRDGYLTAASTPPDARHGFVFNHCRITGEAPEVRTYLGRPWRDHAKVVFLNTEMSEVVRSDGWHNWNRPEREKTAFYAEFGSTGPGAAAEARVAWARRLTAEEAAATSVAAVLGGADGWQPEARTTPPDEAIAASRYDANAIPGFTVEGVLRYTARSHPNAGIRRVSGETPAGVVAKEGIIYSTPAGIDLGLDVYRPHGTERLPAVLIVHGGGWVAGDRLMERPFAKQLAARGYVAVPVSYRLGPPGTFPGPIHDLKAAVRFLRTHADAHGIDPARIAIVGASAGGALAALVGASNAQAGLEGDGGWPDASSRVQAVVCIDGAATFLDERLIRNSEKNPSRFLVYQGGPYSRNREKWQAASAITYVDRGSAPTLFLNSTAEQPILPGRDTMAARLGELGVSSRVVVVPDTPHPFWLIHPWFERAVAETDGFLREQFVAETRP